MHGVKPSALRPRVGASTGLMNLPTQTPTGLLKGGEAPPTPAKAPGASPSSLPRPGPAPQPLSEIPGGKPGLGLCFPSQQVWLASPPPPEQPGPACRQSPPLSPAHSQKLRWERPGLGVSPARCQPPTAVRPWAEQASLSPGTEVGEGLGRQHGGGWADMGCPPRSWRRSAPSRGHCPLPLGAGHPSFPAPPPLGCNYGSSRLIAGVDSLLAPLP